MCNLVDLKDTKQCFVKIPAIELHYKNKTIIWLYNIHSTMFMTNERDMVSTMDYSNRSLKIIVV